MEIDENLTMLKRRKGIILFSMVLCAGAALIYSSLQRPSYRAEVMLTLSNRNILASRADGEESASTEAMQTASLEIGDLELARKVAKEMDYEVRPAVLMSVVDIEQEWSDVATDNPSSSGSTLYLGATYSNPRLAVKIANVYAESLVDAVATSGSKKSEAALGVLDKEIRLCRGEIRNISKQMSAAGQSPPALSASGGVTLTPGSSADMEMYAEWARLMGSYSRLTQKRDELSLGAGKTENSGIQIARPAYAADSTKRPPAADGLFGLLGGLMLGICTAGLMEYSDKRLKTAGDLEKAFNSHILGAVRRGNKNGSELVVASKPKSTRSEQYRLLRTNIKYLAEQKKIKTILFVNAGEGDAACELLANTAASFAQAGYQACVVCSNSHTAALQSFFPSLRENAKGLSDWLKAGTESDTYVFSTDIKGLKVMPSGNLPSRLPELLDSPNLVHVVSYLKRHFDLILFDSPSVLEATDAVILAQNVDGAVIVVPKQNLAPDLAVQTRQRLGAVNTNIIGLAVVDS